MEIEKCKKVAQKYNEVPEMSRHEETVGVGNRHTKNEDEEAIVQFP